MGHSDHWDAVRGLSILVIVFIHTSSLVGWNPFVIDLLTLAFPFIEIIFFLSGFLIFQRTRQHLTTDGIGLGKVMRYFALRRIIRTWPMYFLVVAVCFALPEFVELPIQSPLWTFLTFTMNIDARVGGLMHMWSLCVEEWCYLVFLLFIPFLRVREISYALLALALLPMVLRISLMLDFGALTPLQYREQIHFSTLLHWDSFWWGCLAGQWYLARGPLLKSEQVFSLAAIPVIIAGYLAFYFYFPSWRWILEILNPEIGALGSLALIFGIQAIPRRALRVCAMPQLGVISYSVYLIHKFVMHNFIVFNREAGFLAPKGWLELGGSYLAVLLSGIIFFLIFEKPILWLLRTRFSFRQARRAEK